jgi:hypothetical protein
MLTMALHARASIRDRFDDCVFADRDPTRPVAVGGGASAALAAATGGPA